MLAAAPDRWTSGTDTETGTETGTDTDAGEQWYPEPAAGSVAQNNQTEAVE